MVRSGLRRGSLEDGDTSNQLAGAAGPFIAAPPKQSRNPKWFCGTTTWPHLVRPGPATVISLIEFSTLIEHVP